MHDPEGVCLLVGRSPGHAGKHPIVPWHESLPLTLARDNKRQRRRLDTTSRSHIAKATIVRHCKVACEDGTPNQVNILAGLASVSEILVERNEVGKGVIDLSFGEG